MSRPRSMILLILWFFWAAGKDLEGLARFSTTSDYYILSSAGLTSLFFFMSGIVFLLNAAAAYYVIRPSPIGYHTLFVALAAGAVQNVATVALAMRDLDGVRKAYEIGREVRGLPVRPEALDLIFTPSAMWTSLALSLGIYALVGLLVYRNRRVFTGPVEYVAEA